MYFSMENLKIQMKYMYLHIQKVLTIHITEYMHSAIPEYMLMLSHSSWR